MLCVRDCKDEREFCIPASITVVAVVPDICPSSSILPICPIPPVCTRIIRLGMLPKGSACVDFLNILLVIGAGVLGLVACNRLLGLGRYNFSLFKFGI